MNQVAIVTGGTSGIGKATALALKASGCTVYEFSRRAQGVEGLHHIAADVTSEDSVRAAVAQVMDAEGRISRSVARMEHDEQTGMDPAKAGAYIAKVALRERSHHPLYAIRADYKFFVFLSKILPAQALNRLIYAIYAK